MRSHHDCIVYTSLTTGDEWRFTGPSGPAAVRVTGTFRTDSSEAIRAAVLAGLGIAVVPAWLVPEAVASGELRAVLPGYVPTAMDVSALYTPTPHVAAKVRVFIDHLAGVFRRSSIFV